MGASPYEAVIPAGSNFRHLDVSVDDAFTWDKLPDTGPDGIYRVTFTSELNPDVLEHDHQMYEKLYSLDRAAHDDALAQPGFLTYYVDKHEITAKGNHTARNFCLWTSKEYAAAASKRPKHQECVRFTMTEGKLVYKSYVVQKDHLLTTPKGLVVTPKGRMVIEYGEVIDYWEAKA